jgi:hypothetical protein
MLTPPIFDISSFYPIDNLYRCLTNERKFRYILANVLDIRKTSTPFQFPRRCCRVSFAVVGTETFPNLAVFRFGDRKIILMNACIKL